MHVAPSILPSFVTLFVSLGPVETPVVFASLTAGRYLKATAGSTVQCRLATLRASPKQKVHQRIHSSPRNIWILRKIEI